MTERKPEAVSLARALSKLGWCSRAQALTLVSTGRVTVDGRAVTDPSFRIDMRRARIAVDGEPVRAGERVYLMMHKPAGYVTTTSDERGRPTVHDLLPRDGQRVNAVGRLDLGSEGLLLFTNDTRWADRILDPSSHMDKRYEVELARPLADADVERAIAGVDAGRGEVLGFRAVSRMGRGPQWVEVVLDEGKNRQIRRVLESLGYDVVRLIRTAIGPVELGSLAPGEVRELTAAEKQSLD
ncbi:MAG TPA: pseudouridine synthase [Longimicrobiales bacterium]|nr:pseudouridine synthase [Longimicrobiales bacterium]